MLPEQQARVEIDRQLAAAGWVVQDYRSMNLRVAQGVAVRELPTAAGPADYVLFVDRQAIGVIEYSVTRRLHHTLRDPADVRMHSRGSHGRVLR